MVTYPLGSVTVGTLPFLSQVVPNTNVHIDMSNRQMVKGAGTFRFYRMRDGGIDFDKFHRTEHYHLYYVESVLLR